MHPYGPSPPFSTPLWSQTPKTWDPKHFAVLPRLIDATHVGGSRSSTGGSIDRLWNVTERPSNFLQSFPHKDSYLQFCAKLSLPQDSDEKLRLTSRNISASAACDVTVHGVACCCRSLKIQLHCIAPSWLNICRCGWLRLLSGTFQEVVQKRGEGN